MLLKTVADRKDFIRWPDPDPGKLVEIFFIYFTSSWRQLDTQAVWKEFNRDRENFAEGIYCYRDTYFFKKIVYLMWWVPVHKRK